MWQSFVLINLPWLDPWLLLRTVDCKGNNSRACNCKFTAFVTSRNSNSSWNCNWRANCRVTRTLPRISVLNRLTETDAFFGDRAQTREARPYDRFLARTGWARYFVRERETREARGNSLLHIEFTFQREPLLNRFQITLTHSLRNIPDPNRLQFMHL